jgi:hypothetical protein
MRIPEKPLPEVANQTCSSRRYDRIAAVFQFHMDAFYAPVKGSVQVAAGSTGKSGAACITLADEWMVGFPPYF